MKARNKELIKNTIIIMLGKFCTQFVVFLLLPLYTAYLTTEEFGTVDLIITYVSLLAPLISLQLENGIFRFLIDERQKNNKTNKYITSSLFCLGLLMIIGVSVIILLSLFININYVYYLCILIAVTMMANYMLQVSRGIGDNVGYSIGSMVAGISSVILNVYFIVFLHTGLYGLLLSQIISNIACTIYLFIRTKLYKYISPNSYDKKELYELLKYSLPLIPGNICWWIVSISDRVILSNIMGYSYNGIYSVSNKFSNAYITVFNMFNISWVESAALHINDEDKDEFFSSVVNRMFKMFSYCAILIIIIMPFIFNIFVKNDFTDSYNYIPFLMLGSIFNVLLGLISPIYIAKKMTKKIAITSFGAGILNIVINLLLIDQIGIWAAVISTVISYAIMSIIRLIDIRKYVKIKIDFKNVIQVISLFIVTTLIYFWNFNMIVKFLLNFLIMIVIVIINKKEILSIIKLYKERKLKNGKI